MIASIRSVRRVAAPLLSLVLVAAGLVAFAPAAQANGTRWCYYQSADADRDGYARIGAVAAPTIAANDLYCPGVFVEHDGDCNDSNAAVHPRHAEIANNGIDDNCEFGIDESTAHHSPTGIGVTQTSFTMRLTYNDDFYVQWQQMGLPISAWLLVTPLDKSAAAYVIERNVVPTGANKEYGDIVIDGLKPTTVYRVYAFLETCMFGCAFGTATEDYYSTTTGTSAVDQARTALVLRALYERRESNYQQVGYGYKLPHIPGLRYQDGTKYGADFGEMWCSEFYSWVADPRLNWKGGRPTTTDDMLWAFSRSGANRPPSEAVSYASRGDYLGLDSDGDGSMNHSAMVLAYDKSTGNFWTVEGNSGNTVAVNQREPWRIKGFGEIVPAMLK